MNDNVPQKFKTIGVVQLVAGLVNVFFGWMFAWVGWSVVGTVCTMATLGMCPFTYLLYFCGFAGFLIVPIGIVEAIVGLMAITSPDSVKGFLAYLPFGQIPALLLGDLVSPIAGIVTFVLAKDPEVTGYISGS